MRTAFAFGAVVLGMLMVGCAPKPSLVGKWKGQISAQGQTINADLNFGKDGKLTTVSTIQGLTLTGVSTYKLDGDTLTTTMEDVQVSGMELPPMAKAAFDAEMAKQKGKAETSTIVFTDSDTVDVTVADQKMTWTRVK